MEPGSEIAHSDAFTWEYHVEHFAFQSPAVEALLRGEMLMALRKGGMMALFTVNTGCKGGPLLSWEWELAIPQLVTSVFIMPGTVRQKRRQ